MAGEGARVALERKPLEIADQPAYPDAEQYALERRTFLKTLGLTLATTATLYGLMRGLSIPEPAKPIRKPAVPQVSLPGDVKLVPVRVAPQTDLGGTPPAPGTSEK